MVGLSKKQALVDYLANELGCEVSDMGPDSDASVDYPDFAVKVAQAVSTHEAARGVLVCGTGIGMALAADKVAGVRASSITSVPFAELSPAQQRQRGVPVRSLCRPSSTRRS